MRRAFHLVNGILNFPGCSTNWNGRGVTWFHTSETGRALAARAEKIEYFCGPIGRAFGQRDRANKLYRTLCFYDGWENTVIGHSNGAAVILAMMKDYTDWPDIEHLHLVCGACEADFEKNGLNHWLRTGRVQHVSVYIAGKDMALRAAHSLLARLLGYGVLGLHGPGDSIAPDVMDQVSIIAESPWDEFGHSGCWQDFYFETTMETFVRQNARLTGGGR